MRDATRIKQLADEALIALNQGLRSDNGNRAIIERNLGEIKTIATDMDARTGRKDPTWWQKVQSRFR